MPTPAEAPDQTTAPAAGTRATRRPFGVWVCLLLALAAVIWLTLDNRDLAEEAGRLTLAGRDREAQHLARIAELERQLAETILQQTDVARMVEQHADAVQRQQEQRETERRTATEPMPEGVRLALLAVRDCLRIEGFDGMRLLSARAIDGNALLDVEVLDHDARTMLRTWWLAARMEFVLDQGKGVLTVTFRDGTCGADNGRHAIADNGESVEFKPVSAALWQERLPYLVKITGEPPPLPAAEAGTPVDSGTRAVWLERLNLMLGMAAGERSWRVAGFETMDGAMFGKVRVQIYDRRKRLQGMGLIERLCIEIDETAGIAQVVLYGGTLQGEGGESTISRDGFRMLLTDVTPRKAIDTMLGMVQKK